MSPQLFPCNVNVPFFFDFFGVSVIGLLAQNAPSPQCLREHPWKASPTRRGGCSLGSESVRDIVVNPKAGVALRGFRDPRIPPICVAFQPITGSLLPGHWVGFHVEHHAVDCLQVKQTGFQELHYIRCHGLQVFGCDFGHRNSWSCCGVVRLRPSICVEGRKDELGWLHFKKSTIRSPPIEHGLVLLGHFQEFAPCSSHSKREWHIVGCSLLSRGQHIPATTAGDKRNTLGQITSTGTGQPKVAVLDSCSSNMVAFMVIKSHRLRLAMTLNAFQQVSHPRNAPTPVLTNIFVCLDFSVRGDVHSASISTFCKVVVGAGVVCQQAIAAFHKVWCVDLAARHDLDGLSVHVVCDADGATWALSTWKIVKTDSQWLKKCRSRHDHSGAVWFQSSQHARLHPTTATAQEWRKPNN